MDSSLYLGNMRNFIIKLIKMILIFTIFYEAHEMVEITILTDTDIDNISKNKLDNILCCFLLHIPFYGRLLTFCTDLSSAYDFIPDKRAELNLYLHLFSV